MPYATFAPRGWFELTLVYAPQYAHDEAANDHHLFYIDADNRCYYDQSAEAFVLRLGGSNVVTTPLTLTWSQKQRLTVTIRSLPHYCGITVSGATTGDVVAVSAAQGPLAPSTPVSTVTILGGSSGAEEGAILYSVTPTVHAAYYDDECSYVSMRIKTAPLTAAGFGGWQRFKRVLPICRQEDPCKVHVDLYRDFAASASEQRSLTNAQVALLGAPDERLQPHLTPAHQKAQAMAVEIYDTEADTTEVHDGQGFSCSGIMVGIQPKRTLARISKKGRL